MSNQTRSLELLRSAEKLHEAGRLPQAEAACREALKASPENPAALHLLGVVLGRLRRGAEAVEVLTRAARAQPKSAYLRQNLGVALMYNGQPTEAEAELREAVRIDPNLATSVSNLGIALKDQGKYAEAMECYHRAIRLKPDYADAHWNLGLVLLRLGDFKNGLAEYEWRGKVRSLKPLPRLAQPRWNGEALGGKAIVLYPEQGYGDAIQFVRYVPMVQRRGGRIVVACPVELRRIFDASFPTAQMVTFGGPFPPIDVECPLISLPLAFGTELNSIPADVPYLKTDPERVEKWRARLGARDGRRRVGIAWAGNSEHHNDRNRSMNPADLRPLGEMREAVFYSVQKDRPPGQTIESPPMSDFMTEVEDFAEAAALIENLDLVISVDTAVAHLAGAIGKPTWVLLPFVTDWRWMQDRTDSPWYPSMRLFRQRSIGDWPGVMNEVVQALRALAARGNPS